MSKSIGGRLAYFSTRVGMRIGCAAARVVPRRWLYWCADQLTWLGFRCFTGFRRRSVRNLRVVFGPSIDEKTAVGIAERSLRNFFYDCVEIGLALVANDDDVRKEIEVVGREHLDQALARGRGVMVLSAHFGNFFLIGCRLALEGYSAHVMVNQPRDGQFANLMDEYRLQVRQKTIHARPREEAIRELSNVLRRNQVAVVISDEFRKGEGARVSFFGKTVIARRGPATLALRTKAAIVPATMVRQANNSLKLIIEPALEFEPNQRPRDAVQRNTERMVRWLEQVIRAYPEQWNWMNLRWWELSSDNSSKKLK